MNRFKKLFLYLSLLALTFGCSSSGTDYDQPAGMQMQAEDPDPTNEEGTPTTLTGEFMDGAHPTSGTATVNAARTKLTLDNFHSETGPILDFYLATDKQATDFIDIGELQGYDGDYMYTLPSNVNYTTHKYLIVWCVEFNVNFGYAVLE